jgi:MoaA/NifB/PqqE/SkfB family radical SAM enzyme
LKYNKQTKIPSKKNFRLFRNKDAIRFHWDIITHCNFDCSYCYARAEEGNWFKISSTDIIENTIEKMKKIDKPLEIILLGGEPTLHPKYFDILDNVWNLHKSGKDLEFGIISNGFSKPYFDDNFLKKHLKYKEKFSFSITYHPSQHSKETQNILKENILKINKDFLLNINVILDTYKNDDKIRDLLDFLVKNNIGFYYNIPFETINNKVQHFDNSEEYLKWLEMININYKSQKELSYNGDLFNDIDVVLNNLQNFEGWSCKNNNFEIKTGSSDFIRMCSNGSKKYSVSEINNLSDMICELNKCLCQGLLSNEKIRTTG